jgi:hypothetical protein
MLAGMRNINQVTERGEGSQQRQILLSELGGQRKEGELSLRGGARELRYRPLSRGHCIVGAGVVSELGG